MQLSAAGCGPEIAIYTPRKKTACQRFVSQRPDGVYYTHRLDQGLGTLSNPLCPHLILGKTETQEQDTINMTTNLPKKKLMRNPHDKVIAGVCGGIADYLHANPTFVRILAFVVLLLPTFGTGPFLYIVLWLFLPTGTQAAGRMGNPIVQSRKRAVPQSICDDQEGQSLTRKGP